MTAHPSTETMSADAARAGVLLVDDRPENLLALEAILEPLDQPLVRAGSGPEALRHLLAEASERRFRAAYDNAPIGIGLADLDGRWREVNRSPCAMTGQALERLRALDAVLARDPGERVALALEVPA